MHDPQDLFLVHIELPRQSAMSIRRIGLERFFDLLFYRHISFIFDASVIDVFVVDMHTTGD